MRIARPNGSRKKWIASETYYEIQIAVDSTASIISVNTVTHHRLPAAG